MKKALIFTASTGGGHNQAAESLKQAYILKGYEVKTIDVLKETSKILDLLIADGYRILVKSVPKMYGGIYKLCDKKSVSYTMTKYFTKMIQNKTFELISKNDPDLIIGTHPLIVNVIGKLKESKKIKLPFITIVTDYQAHQTYVNKNVDAYITGSKYTKNCLIKRGIPRKKIYSYGIPIRKEFFNQSNNIRKKDEDFFTILLMGGSMGVKFILKALKYLTKNDKKLEIIVVCGNNKILKYRINKKYGSQKHKNKKFKIYGFTKKIPQIMEMADVIITKPGGLTVSESIAKNIPMIIPFVIPGQEEENADFLVNSNVAIRIDQLYTLNSVIDDLVDNPEKLKEMNTNMKELSKVFSMDSIVELSSDLINKYSGRWKKAYGE